MMRSHLHPITGFRLLTTLTGLALAATLFAGIAGAEEPPVPAPAVESLPDLTAELQIKSIDRRGHVGVSTVHIHRSGEVIRYEHRDIHPPELSIMDFGKMNEYRVYAEDKIYFEVPIHTRMAYKAQRERLIRSNPPPISLRNGSC